MDKQIQEWVDALRSGKYKQTKGALEINGAYCCLGVLSKLNDWEHIAGVLPGNPGSDEYEGELLNHQEVDGVNNTDVYGLADELLFNNNLNISDYIGMNDDDGATFKEIADQIEKDYKENNDD